MKSIYENVRKKSPLVHSITNYVTAGDCANILLACGARPIMSDEPEEAESITSISDGLNINIGTLSKESVKSMMISGKTANRLRIPVLLDPVGVGASPYRTDTVKKLTKEISFSVIKGNMSEIKAMFSGSGNGIGVDVSPRDRTNSDNFKENINFVKRAALTAGCVIAATGETDIISDGRKTFCIFNGTSEMERITGAGCRLAAMMTSFIAANPDRILEAAAAAACVLGFCGEKAEARMKREDGNASFGVYLTDEVYNLTPDELERGARYEIM